MSLSHHQQTKAIKAFKNSSKGTLRVLQITDTHLYGNADKTLAGINTERSFHSVLKIAKKLPIADLLLLTGDLVHDSSAKGYQKFCTAIQQLNIPSYCIPGNHDDSILMHQEVIKHGLHNLEHTIKGNWLFIFLDSSIPHEAGSHFSQSELKRLEDGLKSATNEQHILICMHHQPLPVASQWMDTMTLDNPDDFFALINQYPQVKGVIFGHIHQEFIGEHQGVKLIGSPSTCIQFTPGKNEFGIDDIAPALRWLVLTPDGDIETDIVRAAEKSEQLNTNVLGYS